MTATVHLFQRGLPVAPRTDVGRRVRLPSGREGAVIGASDRYEGKVHIEYLDGPSRSKARQVLIDRKLLEFL